MPMPRTKKNLTRYQAVKAFHAIQKKLASKQNISIQALLEGREKTSCCGATVTYVEDTLVCKACFRAI